MATVSLTIPASAMTDLTAIAKAEGFATAKALVIHWLTAKLMSYREKQAIEAAKANIAPSEAIT